MSNKNLEQATEEQARYYYSIGSFTDEMGIRCFKSGVNWLSKNLHLLSPSDVAKIECVRELISALKIARKDERERIFEEVGSPGFDGPMMIETKYDKALSNFEPKKESANE